MKILIVDDALTFRSQIKRALNAPGIEIVGSASNGRVAIDMILEEPSIELITLDMNMPVMDGLQTIAEIKKLGLKVKIIVFASRTDKSARDTLDALALGADDFIVKPEAKNVSFDKAHLGIQEDLLPKVIQFSKNLQKNQPIITSPTITHSEKEKTNTTADNIIIKKSLLHFKPEIIVVASSTGGPSALDKFFRKIIEKPPEVPILVVQHMPETFTKHLADRLGELLKFPFAEGIDKEKLKKGRVYIAPGNYHMEVKQVLGQNYISINQEERVKNVRPAAELLFKSVVKLYGSTTMGFVLTGMGNDGLDGCRLIKEAGGGVMIQDEESSTVWGMPGAVAEQELHDKIGSIEECGDMLRILSSL